MEMPAFAHRAMFCSNGRQVAPTAALALPGVKTIRPTFIGCVNAISPEQRRHWLESMHRLGMEKI
jgi:putative NADPH-quinone reductase